MATNIKLQIKRCTSANRTSYTPAEGEMLYETDTEKLYMGNGSTAGGIEQTNFGSSYITTALIDAKGDLVVGTADDTPSKLTVGSDSQVLVADSTEASGLKWVNNCFGGCYKLSLKAANHTATLDESLWLFGQTGTATLTMFEATNIPNTGIAREFGAYNLGTGILTVSLQGTDTFNNGISNIDVNPGEFVRFMGAYPNTGNGWVMLQAPSAKVQLGRGAAWTASSFSSLTAVPLDTVDRISDKYRINADLSTQPTRITALLTGSYRVSCHGNINSTGGSSYSVLGYIRKNGTTKIVGTDFAFGNYQTEDTFFTLPPINTYLTSGDYLELMIDQNNLTGSAENITFILAED